METEHKRTHTHQLYQQIKFMKNLAKLFGSYNQSCISYLSNLYISYSCSYLPLVFQFSSHFVVWLRWFHKKLQYRPIFGLEIENRRISYKWQKRKFPNKPSNLFISISGIPHIGQIQNIDRKLFIPWLLGSIQFLFYPCPKVFVSSFFFDRRCYFNECLTMWRRVGLNEITTKI